jgi:hypothetical protein
MSNGVRKWSTKNSGNLTPRTEYKNSRKVRKTP